MIGFKIFLTGLVVFVALAVVSLALDPIESNCTYFMLGLGALLSFIAVFSGALMMVWSL